MMLEVLRRRYRVPRENDFPDLLMVDSARTAQHRLRPWTNWALPTSEVVGIAKSRLQVTRRLGPPATATKNFIVPGARRGAFPGQFSCPVSVATSAYEAHRFGGHLSQDPAPAPATHSTWKTFQVWVSSVKPNSYGTSGVEARFASLARSLSAVPGMPQSVARVVYEYFHPLPAGEDEGTRRGGEGEHAENAPFRIVQDAI